MVNKKKLIEELEKEVAELIAASGRCEQEIFTDFNDYCALKKRSNNLGSILNDRDIWRMKDLHPAFLLGKSIQKKQGKIQAARKAAAANAFAATAASSNVVNTSISSTAAPADSFTSSTTTANKIRASIDYTPPSIGISSSSCASTNDTDRASLGINSLSDQSSISTSHSVNEITASFETNASFGLSVLRSNLFNSSSERLTNTSTTTTSTSTNNTKTNFNGDYIGHLLFYLSSALSC
jgi:hypothetical protein